VVFDESPDKREVEPLLKAVIEVDLGYEFFERDAAK
jgi:hypothetical protein